jgi:hypothetical protein
LTIFAIYFALARISDAASAALFLFFVAWLALPIILTFGSLYFEIHGMSIRRRKKKRPAEDEP